ncbi:DUF6893 family small protein [Streptomyces lavendulae]|uniref:Uncharacterized protein n=1 Tax=Streptomyces lavendulae subsp. lavendulae TaxID=58340 RepID=A0A2K8PMW0_STRLA|nr:hypothetical protein SLAV_31545 [Streptomyces lavendulae subsp. lavendulae]QUQ57909.1 hypothetical protein SLLC_29715 [Streptomyces lavendulae subsp. lavendulae]
MKKAVIGTAAAVALVAVLAQVLPDLKRYLRMRCM